MPVGNARLIHTQWVPESGFHVIVFGMARVMRSVWSERYAYLQHNGNGIGYIGTTAQTLWRLQLVERSSRAK